MRKNIILVCFILGVFADYANADDFSTAANASIYPIELTKDTAKQVQVKETSIQAKDSIKRANLQPCKGLEEYSSEDLKQYYKDQLNEPCINKWGHSTHAILDAASIGNYTAVSTFVKAGANPNIQDPKLLMSPLHYVIFNLSTQSRKDKENNNKKALGLAAITDLLNNPNININIEQINKETPLFWAAAKSKSPYVDKQLFFNIVKLLVERGADISKKSNKGETAINVADGLVKSYLEQELAKQSKPDS